MIYGQVCTHLSNIKIITDYIMKVMSHMMECREKS